MGRAPKRKGEQPRLVIKPCRLDVIPVLQANATATQKEQLERSGWALLPDSLIRQTMGRRQTVVRRTCIFRMIVKIVQWNGSKTSANLISVAKLFSLKLLAVVIYIGNAIVRG
jgi:hypothetical protein